MAKIKTPETSLRKVRRGKKIIKVVEIFFAIIFISLATIYFVPPVKKAFVQGISQTCIGKVLLKWFGSEAYEKGIFDDEFDKSKITKNKLKYDYSKEYLNFVMFGVDSRNGEVDTSNSDSILIVSIHNTTGKVKMVSVYRDTMLGIYGKDGTLNKYFKVNSAMSGGGPEAAINTLNKNLDLDLTDYVTVNFAGVAEIIDTLGGIEVNLTDDELSQLNKHLKSTKSSTGRKSKKIKKAGNGIKLNGMQAATYCRIRKATFIDPETGDRISNDFGRAARQRSVIKKLVEKAKSAGITQLEEMVDTVLNADTKEKRIISTSFDFDSIINMIPILFDFELDGSKGFPATLQTGTFSGASYVIPQGLAANVSKVHEFLYGEKNYQPTSTVITHGNYITSQTGISEFSEGYDPLTAEGSEKIVPVKKKTDYDYNDHWNSEFFR